MKVIDMHCDTIGEIYALRQKGKTIHLSENELHVDMKKLKAGDYMAQCFAMFVPYTVENPLETCLEMIDCFYEELNANKDSLALATTYEDVIKNKQDGKISAILTVEEGEVTKGDLRYLRILYRLGVRMITLTWNYENGIGYPNFTMSEKPDFHTPNTTDGLTPAGIALVQEMNRLGMIIDVSHLSDAGFYDVLKYTTGPFVASHSNSRSVCPHVRNMTDDMIKALAARGGVIGINYCADFLNEEAGFSYVYDMVKHIEHIISVGGIDCVALGSDFDGIPSCLEMKDASMLSCLYDALGKKGFNQEAIEKIFYKNFLRVFKEVTK